MHIAAKFVFDFAILIHRYYGFIQVIITFQCLANIEVIVAAVFLPLAVRVSTGALRPHCLSQAGKALLAIENQMIRVIGDLFRIDTFHPARLETHLAPRLHQHHSADRKRSGDADQQAFDVIIISHTQPRWKSGSWILPVVMYLRKSGSEVLSLRNVVMSFPCCGVV